MKWSAKGQVWDRVRKKAVAATPEEQVRQRFIAFLQGIGCPLSAIQVEYKVGNGRFDVAVWRPEGDLWLLAECKAVSHLIEEKAWLQARMQLARYLRALPPVRYGAVVINEKMWWWRIDTGEVLTAVPTYPA
ncbi:MAG: type I restriction enzyme HsdR N-terminal domain-containing protein [Bacteroidia bacterium]|nr:type I restriction enzyme HsdR N-terminal domain-containing protein [Bacteroidia bacterium]